MTAQEQTYHLVAQNLILRNALRETTAALAACLKAGQANPNMTITVDSGLTYKPLASIYYAADLVLFNQTKKI